MTHFFLNVRPSWLFTAHVSLLLGTHQTEMTLHG